MKKFDRMLAILGGFTAFLAFVTSPVAAETGTLKMRFVYAGDPPQAEPLNVAQNGEFCGKHDLKNEELVVDPETKGIKNIVVYIDSRRSDIPEQTPVNNTHILANKNCRFEPHVVLAQTGDTLKVTNPDPVGHNANLNFFRNTAQNLMIPASQEKSVSLEEAEPAPIPVDCNIHPWMRSYVVVLDHPFADVTGTNGEITIEGLPVGEELTFRVWHEKGRIDEVVINGDEEKWRRGRFELEIKAGMNDLGTVTVPAKAFD